mmetsp:Transcript_38540/g.84431  ORF Transcript_38540/g.84431 Transcript_38540/m.84431 type:complete len:202 (+) Transcript_38540:2944-3549(+)
MRMATFTWLAAARRSSTEEVSWYLPWKSTRSQTSALACRVAWPSARHMQSSARRVQSQWFLQSLARSRCQLCSASCSSPSRPRRSRRSSLSATTSRRDPQGSQSASALLSAWACPPSPNLRRSPRGSGWRMRSPLMAPGRSRWHQSSPAPMTRLSPVPQTPWASPGRSGLRATSRPQRRRRRSMASLSASFSGSTGCQRAP